MLSELLQDGTSGPLQPDRFPVKVGKRSVQSLGLAVPNDDVIVGFSVRMHVGVRQKVVALADPKKCAPFTHQLGNVVR